MVKEAGKTERKNPFSDLNKDELRECRNSLLEILHKIEIETTDTEFNRHLKNVYKLLSQLPEENNESNFL